MDQEKLLKELSKALHERAKELGFETISEYTLNQVIMMYKKEHNSPALPARMINDINQNIKTQVDKQFDKIVNQMNNPLVNPFIPDPPKSNFRVTNLNEYRQKKKKEKEC
jgi:hypothetical protein